MTNELVPVEYDGFLTQLNDSDLDTQRSAMLGIEGSLVDLDENKEVIEVVEASIYHAVKTLWDNKTIAQEIRNEYEDDFYKWAVMVSLKGREEVSPVTVQNKIRVYDTWFSEENKIEPPPQVYLPVYDDTGDYVKEVDFNLADVPFTKLLVSTVPARDGNMSEECWTGLIDPAASVEDLKQEIRKARQIDNGGDDNDKPESEIWNNHGIIYYSEDGVTTEVAQLLYSEQPLNKFAINYLLQAFGLEADANYLNEVDRGNIPTVMLTEGEGHIQLGCRGTVFATYTKDEAKQIHTLLGELLKEEVVEDITMGYSESESIDEKS